MGLSSFPFGGGGSHSLNISFFIVFIFLLLNLMFGSWFPSLEYEVSSLPNQKTPLLDGDRRKSFNRKSRKEPNSPKLLVCLFFLTSIWTMEIDLVLNNKKIKTQLMARRKRK